MFHPKDFCSALNESKWKGAISEVGIGVPFQSQYFAEPGASNTILFTQSPYIFRPKGLERSVVSKDMSVSMANEAIFKLWGYGFQDNVFSLAVTASHKRPDERGESHGWVSVSTWEIAPNVLETHSFHFKLKKEYEAAFGDGIRTFDVSRNFAGAMYAWRIRWFLSMVLLEKWDNWGDAIDAMPRSAYDLIDIDVIDSPTITSEEHLKLSEHGNALSM